VIPLARHFLGRLRTALHVASKNTRRLHKLSAACIADLRLWLLFLRRARSGMSLNNLILQIAKWIFRTDACEHGIGGYCLNTGCAWRWELPVDLRLRASLNSLEFLACYVGMAVEFAWGNIPTESCLLSQTDSTSAAGWLRKSNFDDGDSFQMWLARQTAQLMLDQSCCLFSQWFAGDKNDVADCLSRDHHLADTELTALLVSHVPEQMPPNFNICPVPPEILSLVISALHRELPTKQSRKVPRRSKLATGVTTSATLSQSNLTMTRSSAKCHHGNEFVLLPPLSTPTETSDFALLHESRAQYHRLAGPPSTLWHRPTGLTNARAHATKTAESCTFFWNDS
jgi:hypothetical protein